MQYFGFLIITYARTNASINLPILHYITQPLKKPL